MAQCLFGRHNPQTYDWGSGKSIPPACLEAFHLENLEITNCSFPLNAHLALFYHENKYLHVHALEFH